MDGVMRKYTLNLNIIVTTFLDIGNKNHNSPEKRKHTRRKGLCCGTGF